jgi:hypothetical protein
VPWRRKQIVTNKTTNLALVISVAAFCDGERLDIKLRAVDFVGMLVGRNQEIEKSEEISTMLGGHGFLRGVVGITIASAAHCRHGRPTHNVAVLGRRWDLLA